MNTKSIQFLLGNERINSASLPIHLTKPVSQHKPHKHRTNIKESLRLVSLINTDIKIFHEILPNEIQQHVKIIHHHQVEDMPRKQSWFNNKKNQSLQTIISKRKSHDHNNSYHFKNGYISQLSKIKAPRKLGIQKEGWFLGLQKICTCVADIQLYGEWLVSLRPETRISTLTTLIQYHQV